MVKDAKINVKNNEIIRQIKYYIIELLEFLLYPAFLYVLLESIKFGNISVYFQLLIKLIIQLPQYIIVSYFILLAVILIFRGIIKNNFIANCIATILFTIITIVSYYKFNILEQPFIPYDIVMAKNLNQITKFGLNGITYCIIFSICNIIILLMLDYFINKFIKDKKTEDNVRYNCKKIIYFVVGIIMLYGFCISPNRYINNGIKNDNGDDYYWMGANGVFFIHLGDFYVIKPEGYTKENIMSIKSEYENSVEKNEEEHPNIILVMNESFADLTNLTNTTYSENPMESIKKFYNEKNCKTGEILSPVLGGGTSLPEFELLTGLTSYYLEQQIYPYTSYIHSDMNSIVREFNKNEYNTVGIHTNTKTFYNREYVYNYLGFKKTIFAQDIENPEYKGNYISDNEAANQIIEQFNSIDGKKFIFALTMQNHMQYTNKNYEYYDIEIQSNVLSNNEKLELKNYTQGIKDACAMYDKLVTYLKDVQEPTVLIMFGDHLPLLGDTYCSTLRKNGYTNGIECYKTPYIIWSNYDIDESIDIPEIISPSYLGLLTLDMANINNLSWYMRPFRELYYRYPAINNKYAIDREGNVIDLNLLKEQEIVKKCEILQYDVLIKKKFIPIVY